MKIQFANTEHLNTDKIFLLIAMKYLLLTVMQGCFKTCISLCAVPKAEGRNYDDVSKIMIHLHQNFVSSSPKMLEMKVQVQIIVRCGTVCTAAILNSVCNS